MIFSIKIILFNNKLQNTLMSVLDGWGSACQDFNLVKRKQLNKFHALEIKLRYYSLFPDTLNGLYVHKRLLKFNKRV